MRLSVIIPVYNEVNTIKEIISQVKRVPIEKEIIVVDDCSNDGTTDILKNIHDSEIKIFLHDKNQGKGGALRTAFRYVAGDIVIIQDADLEYDPREYVYLIEPIVNGVADVVYGSRLCGGKPQRVYMFWHKIGNRFITLVANILYNNTLTDIETGYKVLKREIAQSLDIKSKSFDVEPEITAKVFKKGCRVYEMPISYYGRTYKEGKKISWKDGFGAIWALLKFKFTD